MFIRKTMILAAAAVLLASCSPGHEPGPLERPEVTGVKVQKVHLTRVPESYETTGTVVPRSSSSVSSRVMGAVTSVTVKEGDRVREGQILATIDDRDLQEQLRGAEEGYNEAVHALESARRQEQLAVKTYERYKKLHEEKAVTDQEFDNVAANADKARHAVEQAQAMVKRAEASRAQARIFLGFSRVASPINGIVTKKTTDVGSMATPGVPLFQLEDRASRLVEAGLEERMLGIVKEGMEVRVKVPSNGEETTGKIVEIVPTVDPRTRTFLVKIHVPDLDLRSGQYGTVRFTSGTRDLLLIPQKAVVERGQLTGAFRVRDDGLVTYRLIRAGRTYGEMIEVLSGLEEGDSIIVENPDRAVDGGILSSASDVGGGN